MDGHDEDASNWSKLLCLCNNSGGLHPVNGISSDYLNLDTRVVHAQDVHVVDFDKSLQSATTCQEDMMSTTMSHPLSNEYTKLTATANKDVGLVRIEELITRINLRVGQAMGIMSRESTSLNRVIPQYARKR